MADIAEVDEAAAPRAREEVTRSYSASGSLRLAATMLEGKVPAPGASRLARARRRETGRHRSFEVGRRRQERAAHVATGPLCPVNDHDYAAAVCDDDDGPVDLRRSARSPHARGAVDFHGPSAAPSARSRPPRAVSASGRPRDRAGRARSGRWGRSLPLRDAPQRAALARIAIRREAVAPASRRRS